MLYQPSYPHPYLGDIDATKNNDFSCYINAEGGTTVTAYDLKINNLNGVQVYTSGKVNLNNNIYSGEILTVEVPSTSGMINGMDYVWNIALYEPNPTVWIAYGTIESVSTETNVYLRKSYLIKNGMYLKINGQMRKISTYEFSTGLAVLETPLSSAPVNDTRYDIYSDSIISNDIFFQARSTPTLSVDEIPSVINGKSYNFKGTYTQNEGVSWKYYQWFIYDDKGNEINTSGKITSGKIEYSFDGFLNNTSYGINLVVENQDDIVLSTPIKMFDVSYLLPEIESSPTATIDCNKNAIKLEWTPLLINNGNGEGTKYRLVPNQPYQGGSSVEIDSDSAIYWYIGSENIPIPINYESTTQLNWHTNDFRFSGNIYKQEGVYVKLIAFTHIPPAQCNIGDKYYNTNDNSIYTAIESNVWSSNSEKPLSTSLYQLLTNQKIYLWDGENLIETDYNLPSYTIWYDNGYFNYEIVNKDVNISGSVKVFDILDAWLLSSQEYDPKINYRWEDDMQWDDSMFWYEQTEGQVEKYWYKITMLPTELQVHKNAIPIEEEE